jgi:splicing factor 3B subunit 3
MSIELDEDEAAFSVTMTYFERMGGEPTLVVGTAVGTTLMPRACKEGWLRVYAIRDAGRVLEFMHKVSQMTRSWDPADQ